MCVVSVISDYGQKNFQTWTAPPFVPFPDAQPTPAKQLSEAELAKVRSFLDLIDRAEEFDRLADQHECTAPDKVEFLAKVRALIAPSENDRKLNGLLAQVTPENQHGEIFTDGPKGKEVW